MMTIDQAYRNLDSVLGTASISINGEAITRQDHAALQQSLQTLLTAAKDKKEEKENGGTDK